MERHQSKYSRDGCATTDWKAKHLSASRLGRAEIRTKDDSIESLRGLAIVLVVFFHAVTATVVWRWGEDRPAQSVSQELYYYLVATLAYVRMPLFTVISGFVYAMRPVEQGIEQSFLTGKARRILLPFVSVVTLVYAAKSLAPGLDNPLQFSDLWHGLFFPFAQFWFLPAIFFVFLVTVALERFRWLDEPQPWLACLLAALLVHLSVPKIEILAFSGFLYLLPFFLFGCGLNRHGSWLMQPRVVAIAACVAPLIFFAEPLGWVDPVDTGAGRRNAFGMLMGLATSLLLVRYRCNVPVLARLGRYAYTIYLFQGFGMEVGRRIWIWTGTGSNDMYLWLKFAGALVLPIFVDEAFRRIAPLRFVFLGLRYRAKRPAVAASPAVVSTAT